MSLLYPSLHRRSTAGGHTSATAVWQVLAALAACYLAVNLLLPGLAPGGWNIYLAQPLLWTALGLHCYQRTARPAASVLSWGLLAGAFHVALFVAASLAWGFGRSAFAHGALSIAGNVLFLATLLFGVEQARARLLRLLSGGALGPERAATVVCVSLLFAAMTLPPASWQALAAAREGFAFGGGMLLPAVCQSLVATALATAGGARPAIAYRAILLCAEWFSPVLPDLTWMQTALVSALAGGIAFSAISANLGPREGRTVPAWLIAFGLAVVGAVWLNAGVFGVQPSVVSGASMQPSLHPGDIVLTRDVAAASLRPGDIVRFQNGGVAVVHRIKRVERTTRGLVFVTQGDNNNFEDAPVSAEAVQGRVVLTVPRLGLIPTTVREWLGGWR